MEQICAKAVCLGPLSSPINGTGRDESKDEHGQAKTIEVTDEQGRKRKEKPWLAGTTVAQKEGALRNVELHHVVGFTTDESSIRQLKVENADAAVIVADVNKVSSP